MGSKLSPQPSTPNPVGSAGLMQPVQSSPVNLYNNNNNKFAFPPQQEQQQPHQQQQARPTTSDPFGSLL